MTEISRGPFEIWTAWRLNPGGANSVAAHVLGAVELRIRPLNQIGGAPGVGRKHGDADAHRELLRPVGPNPVVSTDSRIFSPKARAPSTLASGRTTANSSPP